MSFKTEHPNLTAIGDFVSHLGHKFTHLMGREVCEGEQGMVQVIDREVIDPLLDGEDLLEDAAIEASRQEYEYIQPSTLFKCGPILRFQDINVKHRRWIGSALIVTDNDEKPPRLCLRDPVKGRIGYSVPSLLETWEGNHFYRYEMQLAMMTHREKKIEYWFEESVIGESGQRPDGYHRQKWNFHVPALEEGHNWAFYSCNGFTSDVEDPETNFHGANPLWDDLMMVHDHRPFHTMVGGGDQIYNDDVLATPEMAEWLGMDSDARIETEFNNEKRYAVEKYYFEHYIQHFTTGTYSKALSLIPSVNTWDDHDILDGYGSYPPHYQLCTVMQGKLNKTLLFSVLTLNRNRVMCGQKKIESRSRHCCPREPIQQRASSLISLFALPIPRQKTKVA